MHNLDKSEGPGWNICVCRMYQGFLSPVCTVGSDVAKAAGVAPPRTLSVDVFTSLPPFNLSRLHLDRYSQALRDTKSFRHCTSAVAFKMQL